MYRNVEENLKKWKKSVTKKPLVISGARQVGKTYSILKFAKENYKSYLYVNFERDLDIKNFMEKTANPKEIISYLEIAYPQINFEEGKTLIIFDEVQACPQALTSIKFLGSETKYDYIVSGSLLGIAIKHTSSYPVGYVESIEMKPMGFDEFLKAMNLKDQVILQLKDYFEKGEPVNEMLHEKFMDYFRTYIIVGGMPEAVKCYVKTKDFMAVRKIQRQIVEDYYRDMAKYAEAKDKIKAHECFSSIPLQLSKDNKKFQYKLVRDGGNARHFETSLQWLKDSGTIHFCHRLKCIDTPLQAYKEQSVFKIYMADTGLLVSQFDESIMKELLKNELGVYKGAIYENITAQMLIKNHHDLYYYEPTTRSEIDFILQEKGNIIPMEVKSGNNTRAKSLHAYVEKYNPVKAYRFSTRNVNAEDPIIKNYPLYMMMFV